MIACPFGKWEIMAPHVFLFSVGCYEFSRFDLIDSTTFTVDHKISPNLRRLFIIPFLQ